jgi:hypothetical protein
MAAAAGFCAGKDATMSLPLIIFIATLFAASLGTAVLLGEGRRFIVAAAVASILLLTVGSGVVTLRSQLQNQITRIGPTAPR